MVFRMCSTKNFKIARFVDLNACKRIFSDHSTFIIGSPERYRYMEGAKKDTHENHVTIGDSTYGIQPFLISCWTKLDGDSPSKEEWKIFEEEKENGKIHRPIIAIVSTPRKVESFLKKKLDIQQKDGVFRDITSNEVTYYNENSKKPDENTCPYWPVFHKRKKTKQGKEFCKEKEYRFAIRIKQHFFCKFFFLLN